MVVGHMIKIEQALLDTLCNIARQAGEAIMDVYSGEIDAWEKDDASPLTKADLCADMVIRNGLTDAFPGVFILSEESVSTGELGNEDFFLVDPLDGTKEFLKRNGEFTVNIAFISNGCPAAGVVFAPALDQLFYAADGLGAWKISAGQLQAINVALPQEGQKLRVVGSRSHGADRVSDWLSSLNVDYSFSAAGSSLKFCRIAEGMADVYPRFGPTSQWDTAAAQCVLEQAGGSVQDVSGERLLYGFDRPILNPEFIASGKQK